MRNAIADGLEYTASVVRKRRDLRAEMDDLHARLRNIEDVKGLDQHAGWKKVRDVLMSRAKQWHKSAYQLAKNDPVKNEREIRLNTSLVEAATHLLATIETTLAAEKDINTKLQYLTEIIQEHGL